MGRDLARSISEAGNRKYMGKQRLFMVDIDHAGGIVSFMGSLLEPQYDDVPAQLVVVGDSSVLHPVSLQ